MTDQAPSTTTTGSTNDFWSQAGAVVLSVAQAEANLKIQQLNAKSKLAQSAMPTSSGVSSTSGFSFGTYAPWIIGGLLLVAVVLVVRR